MSQKLPKLEVAVLPIAPELNNYAIAFKISPTTAILFTVS